MKDEKDEIIEIAYAANQLFLFRFVVYLILICCIGALLCGIFGNNFQNILEKPKPLATEKRKNKTVKISNNTEEDEVANGIHLQTGLAFSEGFEIVRGTCTACHSAKLITQNRATREGWKEMIRWMQKTQGLWDLGKNEIIILDYLAKHYAPEEIERRPGLDMNAIEWYILDLEEEQNQEFVQ